MTIYSSVIVTVRALGGLVILTFEPKVVSYIPLATTIPNMTSTFCFRMFIAHITLKATQYKAFSSYGLFNVITDFYPSIMWPCDLITGQQLTHNKTNHSVILSFPEFFS